MPAEEKMFTFPKSVWMYKWGRIPFNVLMFAVIIWCGLNNPYDDPRLFRNGIIIISVILLFTLWMDWGAYKDRTTPRYIWVNENGIKGKDLVGRETYFRWEEIKKIILYRVQPCIVLLKEDSKQRLIVGTSIINFKEELYPFIKSHAKNAEIITKFGW